MAAVVTKFRIRSTCAVRVTQARHPVVRVYRQVSHNSSKKKYQKISKLFFWVPPPFLCVCVCVCECGLFVCRRRVDRLIVSGCCVWSTDPDCMSLSKLRDFIFLSRCQRFLSSNSGAAGIDYWSHTHTHTHQKKMYTCIHSIYILLSFSMCIFLFLL